MNPMRNPNPLIPFAALLIGTAAIAKPNGPPAAGNGTNPMLEQVNKGALSVAANGFEENKGQVRTMADEPAPFVHYRLTQGNTSIFLLGNGIAYQFNRTHYPESYAERHAEREKDPMHDAEKEKQLDALRKEIRLETFRMDMVLEGAEPAPRISTEGKSTDYTNHYTYNALDVHTFARVTYHDVYPGIDWVVYTTEQGMKYDFVVRPGADPARIKLRFKDQEELRLDEEGRLIQGNSMGRFMEEKPVSFQDGNEVPTRFQLKGELMTFALGNYDPARTLTIDPERIWGTYYGGAGNEFGKSCCVDTDGNVYLAGDTESSSGIASGGHQNTYSGGFHYGDAFLVKFDAAGIRLWSTYYGGGGDERYAYCAVDPSGNVYLAGQTRSHVGIASGGHQNTYGGGNYYGDAYLVKFDPAGTRLWGTYYGGTGDEEIGSCAVDPSGNVYLAGRTESLWHIASVNGYQNTLISIGGSTVRSDAFLVKFNPDGTRLWGTYYGGTNIDRGHSCAVDPADGNVYLAGFTWSSTGIASGGHLDTLSGLVDAFLVKFDPTGTRLWGTYYGGIKNTLGRSCAVDLSGNVYLAGDTYSSSGIASGGHQNTIGDNTFYGEAFLVKFNSAGARQWGTYYGGAMSDFGTCCAADPSGNVYLAGRTQSSTGIASGGYQNTYGGQGYFGGDAFLVKFDPAGTRLWGTYYGGPGDDLGWSCAVDPGGYVYLAGDAGSPSGMAIGGHQNTSGGNSDAYLVKFDGGTDLCPGGLVPGTACDDGDANTFNDVVQSDCSCSGTPMEPCTEQQVIVHFTLDNFGSQTTWTLRPSMDTTVIASGGPYADGVAGTVVSENVCVPAGSYRLRVYDADGMGAGGYVVTDGQGQRIIDADGDFTELSASGVVFTLPLGPVELLPDYCDLTGATAQDSLFCTPVAGATAYTFWLFDPHTALRRKIIKLNPRIGPYDLANTPDGLNLNVRVRAKVGGVFTPYGPACRITTHTVPEAPLANGAPGLFEPARITAWPNPNNGDRLNISLTGINPETRIATATLVDATGRQVMSITLQAVDGMLNASLDLGDAVNGVYLLRINADGQVIESRITVVRN